MTRRKGRITYRAAKRNEELLRLETEAAAAEGRCRGRLPGEDFESLKTQEQAEYLDPWQRLDFWSKAEQGISQVQTQL